MEMNTQERVYTKKLVKRIIKQKLYCPQCKDWPPLLKAVKSNNNWLFCPKCDLMVKIIVIEGVNNEPQNIS